jgi:hypothetical protein
MPIFFVASSQHIPLCTVVEVSGSGLAEHESIRRLTAQALWYCLGRIRSSTAYALLLYSNVHVPRYHTGRDYMISS